MRAVARRSLAHTDGTKPSRQISEEDKKFFFDAMAVRCRQPRRLGTLTLPTLCALALSGCGGAAGCAAHAVQLQHCLRTNMRVTRVSLLRLRRRPLSTRWLA